MDGRPPHFKPELLAPTNLPLCQALSSQMQDSPAHPGRGGLWRDVQGAKGGTLQPLECSPRATAGGVPTCVRSTDAHARPRVEGRNALGGRGGVLASSGQAPRSQARPYCQAVHAGLGILPGTTSDHGGRLATWGHPSGQTVRREGSRSQDMGADRKSTRLNSSH